MSIQKSLLFVLTLAATVALADDPAVVAPAAGAVSITSAVSTPVAFQGPQGRDWYRTAVLLMGIAAISVTFVHGFSTKRKSN